MQEIYYQKKKKGEKSVRIYSPQAFEINDHFIG
ncbi:MAG: hypothetical protein JSC188_000628 [Candidatus Tokpelaia sp. JSC188]|nr:MAG: hypothetical protein JSC188_000628 [Candidatus Tokpelaia sp. JSC188]